MDELKDSNQKGLGSSLGNKKNRAKLSSSQKRKSKSNSSTQDEYSIAGLKYKTPGRRQRIIVGSIVIGLNLILVIMALLYFNNPLFHDFIYHIGRN